MVSLSIYTFMPLLRLCLSRIISLFKDITWLRKMILKITWLKGIIVNELQNTQENFNTSRNIWLIEKLWLEHFEKNLILNMQIWHIHLFL